MWWRCLSYCLSYLPLNWLNLHSIYDKMVILEAIHYAEEQSRPGHAPAFIILLAKKKLR